MELESMTGKPVHTLAVDGNQTSDDSTVLGARLTQEQLEQLADIFADRQALHHATLARESADVLVHSALACMIVH